MTRTANHVQMPLTGHPVAFGPVNQQLGNRLLEDWGHYLGPCLRPFGIEAWLLEVAGDPVCIAVGASVVSGNVGRWTRRDVVELARLCSAPDARWATRVGLRLWREVAAQSWPHWPVTAAVAYSQDARHPGSIYRFDGWEKVASSAGSSGGGTYTKTRDTEHAASGRKTLWAWEYPT